jgi:curved DNA-binding protein CbpA
MEGEVMFKNYYEILNVKPDATEEEIRKAYIELVSRYNPDDNPENEEARRKFHDVKEAYDILSNPTKRKAYSIFGEVSGILGKSKDLCMDIFGELNKTRNSVVMTRVDDETARSIDYLVDAGLFKSRSESAAFLISEGIKARSELFGKIGEKIKQINEIKDDLRKIVSEELRQGDSI